MSVRGSAQAARAVITNQPARSTESRAGGLSSFFLLFQYSAVNTDSGSNGSCYTRRGVFIGESSGP